MRQEKRTTRAETTLLCQSRHPPPNPTCSFAPQPAQPTTRTTTPPPLPAQSLTHTHTPFSLSCCVPVPLSHSLSISSKWPELLSSLLSSLYPSTTLFLSPPALPCSSSPPQVKRIHRPATFPKLVLKTLFSFLTPFYSRSLTLPLRRGWSVCTSRVLGSVCEASGVVLFALREPLKLVTEVETFSPR